MLSDRLKSFILRSYWLCFSLCAFPTLRAPHNKRNKEQRIRISIYQKLCIPQYMISDRLKFLFSVLCFLFLLLCEIPKTAFSCWRSIRTLKQVTWSKLILGICQLYSHDLFWRLNLTSSISMKMHPKNQPENNREQRIRISSIRNCVFHNTWFQPIRNWIHWNTRFLIS